MAKRGIDIKLNIRPIFLALIHLTVFEGPCRFGHDEELETAYDQMVEAELFEQYKKDLKKYLDNPMFNVMEPIYVERNEDFMSPESMFETMAQDIDQVDLFLFNTEIGRTDITTEFAQRYKKPIAIMPFNCCCIADCVPPVIARGLEAYGFLDWDDAVKTMKALRVRKVLKNMNVLISPRYNANKSFSSESSFNSLAQVTDKFGIKFRVLNFHELMDTTHVVDPKSNPTVPGRDIHNLTQEDMVEIEKIADELIAGADVCAMEREKVIKSVKLYYNVQKQMKIYDCNAFSMPCPDACASRRLNEEQFTSCLCHSLNNEQGIPSACEYDIGAVVAMMILNNLSNSAAYMGNSNPINYDENGEAMPDRVITAEHLKDIKTNPNLYWTFHSTPNRKLHGFDKPMAPYGIQPFAYSGWGVTLRYDFNRDIGQEITMCRISPDCSKLFIGKGKIVGGGGYDAQNCSLSVIFEVHDRKDFFKKHIRYGGNHLPLVYGDYTEELEILAEMLGLEAVKAY